ncbi:DJ-1/PfpI family protein [Mucilaginibacter humi]|uniref:DJ-1/PfpI family protein n=1 Tax=Mucilaginibacter humi TaxID=2732510 RepID=UPI001FED113F|nr:DJ-1/PfpI family protein [Mucilaginibacter humi]
MIQLGILLTNRYRLLSVAAILDVFESVNRFYVNDGKAPAFDISLFSADVIDQQKAIEFNSYQIQQTDTAAKQDLIFIPAFVSADIGLAIRENQKYIPRLQQQFKAGAELACVCTGAFLLGATGLLNGRPATTHVDACKQFASAFPTVKLQEDKVVTGDGGLYTSGGSTSSFHLMLHLLQKYCGKDIAVRTAKLFLLIWIGSIKHISVLSRHYSSIMMNWLPWHKEVLKAHITALVP